jgi:DNA-binding Lrp family transcriptional regulator
MGWLGHASTIAQGVALVLAKFLAARRIPSFIRVMTTKTATLDKFDHALLRLVQKDNLTPARVLAEKVGLSESAVLRRLRVLRANGTIIADRAIVGQIALGVPLSVHVLVSLEREGARELDDFIRKIKKRSEVSQASYVTGDADFVMLLRLSGMDQYDLFTQEVFHDDANVKSFRTLVTIRDVMPGTD